MSFYNGILNHDDVHGSGQIGPRGVPGIGFKLTSDGNYDIENKKLKNVQNGDSDQDVMTKKQIESYVSTKTIYLKDVNPGQVVNNKAAIYSNSGSLHTNALYLEDQYEQEVIFHTEDQDDNQIRLYIPNLKNNDSFGGRAKSSIVVTSIDQTIQGKKTFSNIIVPNPSQYHQAANKQYVDSEISKISGSSDNNYVRKSGDTMTGPLIIQQDQYPIQGNLNKVISYETQREIFLSKKEGGKMLQPIDMNGFTIDNLPLPTAPDHCSSKGYVDNNFLNRLIGGQIGGDIDMRGHSIKYLKLDNSDSAAARVSELNLKADKSDLNNYLKLDGTKAMTGNLNMNNHSIQNVKDPVNEYDSINKKYVDNKVNSKADLSDLNDYLKLDGSRAMIGNLNINNNRIQNLKSPSNEKDAANKNYIDNSMVQQAHSPINILDFIMKDVNQTSSEYGIEIDKIDDYDNSFHTYNKKVIYLKLIKDGNNYRARIGYNIFQLIDKSKNKFYTAVIEWLTTDNNAWNKMELFHNITSGSIISNQTRKFEDGKGLYYTRSIVQFEVMAISSAPLYLFSTIHIDGVNPTYPAKFTEVYNIIYGTDGQHKALSPQVYDYHEAFEIEKDKMKMLVNLDMNNRKLTNIENLSNFGMIDIYGKVIKGFNENGFEMLDTIPLRFSKIFINWIRIIQSDNSKGKADVLILLSSGLKESRNPFTFPSNGGLVTIQIGTYFKYIMKFRLLNTYNVLFHLTYQLFY